MRIVSLDHLTVFELTPPEVVRIAADSGYSHVGLRLKPAADRTNGKVMIDTIHVDRVGSTAVEIAALPAHRIVYAQRCDGRCHVPPTSIR